MVSYVKNDVAILGATLTVAGVSVHGADVGE